MSVLPHPIFRVAITGGIAAGKSAVAELWRQHALAVIDSDVLAHDALVPGNPTHDAVVEKFGPDILNPDLTINRARLGAIVFQNEPARDALNRLIHPVIRQKRDETFAALEPRAPGIALAVIPLLYEVASEKEMDCVVVVACSETTQHARLTAKGFNNTQARARITAQWPVQKKIDRADFVILNDGTRRALAEQADIIWQRIKEIHHATRQT